MKFIHKAPLSVLLLVTGVILTILALEGRRYGYKDYELHLLRQPAFTVVFEGLHDRVFPWGKKTSAAEEEAEALLAEDASEENKSAGGATDLVADDAATEAVTEEVAAPHVNLTIPDGVNNPVVPAIDYGNSNSAYLSKEGMRWEKDMEGIFATDGTYYQLQAVDDGYFADAIFIGDSRTEGLYVYSSMKYLTTFDAKDSATIYTIYDKALDYYDIDGTSGEKTAMEALQEKQYRKVYFSVGINELGMPTEDYFEKYKEFVKVIRKLQPDAIIYVQGIMHVTASYAQANDVYNNTNIVDKNTAIATLANGRDIFYIDMNSAVCDADGNVPEDISYDGIHLKASAYETWHEFLRQNAIVRTDEDWKPQVTEAPATADTIAAEGGTTGDTAAATAVETDTTTLSPEGSQAATPDSTTGNNVSAESNVSAGDNGIAVGNVSGGGNVPAAGNEAAQAANGTE
ncbi:GDSL-like Lipase/Acylhydrolase family protein [Lachnospiraceae bacterium NK3A20]|nr:GDSL-like Lipase/Acylhydrolase family protein [Lachnospiraceae bacterium NK3A20]